MIFKMDNKIRDFYVIMGKYFADRGIVKEMDGQIYDNGFTWYIYLDSNTVLGFISVEDRGAYKYIDNFYVTPDNREEGIGRELLERALKDTSGVVKAISRNAIAIRLFESLGFTRTGNNGRYVKLERGA
jgi:GNAT superfamily N-acetyltransferase